MASAEMYWWGGRIELTHNEIETSTNAADTASHIGTIVAGALALVPGINAAAVSVAGIVAGVAGLGSQVLKNSDKGNGVYVYWIDVHKLQFKGYFTMMRAIPLFWFDPGKDFLDRLHSNNDNSVSFYLIPCFATSR